MRKSILSFAGALALAASFTAHASDTLRGGFVPGADMMFYLEAATFANAPIVEKIQAMNPDHDATAQEEMAEKFEAATGLAEEDMRDVALTLDLGGIDFDNPDPDQFDTVSAVMAMGLNKSITLDQVVAGIELLAAENGGADEIDLAKENREGTDLIVVTPTTAQDGPKEILAGLSQDGKTVLVTFNLAALTSGLDRITEQKIAKPGPEMEGALRELKGQPFRVAFVLPEDLKQEIAVGAQANPMTASLASLQAVLFGAKAGDDLELNLKLDMGNNQAATQATAMVQGMLPMAAMQLEAMLPQAANAAQKIKVAAEGNYVSAGIRLTAEDLEGGAGGGAGGPNGGMMMPQQ